MKTKVETVLGPVDADELKKTLTHEHTSCNFDKIAQQKPQDDEAKIYNLIKLENLDWFRHNAYSCTPNLKLDDYRNDVIDELKVFKEAGGSTVVDNTNIGLKRDVRKMKAISEATGVNIVCGTGYYLDAFLDGHTRELSVEQMTENILSEINNGIDQTTIKPGIIGEVGCTWPLTAAEKRSLQAAAIAQRQSQTPVSVHPGHNRAAPEEIMRMFLEAGGDARRTVMDHLDRTINDTGDLLEFAKHGTYLEYDFFGTECSYLSYLRGVDMMCDAQRIEKISTLISAGFADRIVVSHDIHACHQLVKYGGHGYAHLLNYAVPKMLVKGITQDDIDKILIGNPKAWLTYC